MMARPLLALGLIALAAVLAGGCGDNDGVVAPPPLAQDPTPLFERTTVFVSGEDGYNTYRIPALVTAPNGDLLAFAEGRPSIEDAGSGEIDIVYKRSTDAGRTWGTLAVLAENGAGDVTNPTAVVVRSTRSRAQRVWVFYTKWPAGTGERNVPAGTGPDSTGLFARHSGDSGRTWSAEIEITKAVKQPDWHITSPGPGLAIQTRWRAGTVTAGRILVPGWRTAGGDLDDGDPESFVFYSDDDGTTWHLGGVTDGNSDESQVVQLTDGSLRLDARQDDLSGATNRRRYTSADGGQTWSEPSDGLAVTPVMTSILRYSARRDGDDRDRLLYSAPRPGATRRGLRVLMSYDEGATWTNETQIERGFSQYSVLTRLTDGTIGLFFETGLNSQYPFQLVIDFARFNLAHLGETPGA